MWFIWPKAESGLPHKLEITASLVSNLLPMAGVIFMSWNVFPILLFYCIESLIVLSLKYTEYHIIWLLQIVKRRL